jgi:hypothetical protein
MAVLVVGLCFATRARGATTEADWSIHLLYGHSEIFPSVLASVNENAPFPPRTTESPQLGDPTGLISALIEAPRDNCPVTVTVQPTELFDRTVLSVRLPVKGESYRVAPWLRLDHERLLNIRHPIAGELITVSVTIDGVTHTKTRAMRVHAINDCLTSVYQAGRIYEVGFLAAAYVNEYNSRLVSTITRHALDKGYVQTFDGYESEDPEQVTRQVEAIYKTLHDLGFMYSALTQSSVNSNKAGTQSIQFVGDVLTSEQANCVDGTVLFASVLTQVNLRAVMFYIPNEHAFLGVYRTRQLGEDGGFDVVETTVVNKYPFSESLKLGKARLAAERSRKGKREIKLMDLLSANQLYSWDPKSPDKTSVFFNIDIGAARAHGILPIAEELPETN